MHVQAASLWPLILAGLCDCRKRCIRSDFWQRERSFLSGDKKLEPPARFAILSRSGVTPCYRRVGCGIGLSALTLIGRRSASIVETRLALVLVSEDSAGDGDRQSQNKVMIVGASGFIGFSCIQSLLRRAHIKIYAVCRGQTVRTEFDDNDNLIWCFVDIMDGNAVKRLISELKPNTIMHLGWYSGNVNIWNNLENVSWVAATLGLVQAAAEHGATRILITGTCAEYAGSGKFKETDTRNPETLYGISKNATRQIIQLVCRAAGISFVWPRLFHMYGPWENPRRLVGGASLALLRGSEFLCSDGLQQRDFLHVEDVGNVLTSLVLGSVEGIINIGSGNVVSLREVLLTVADVVGRRDLLIFGARPRAENDPDLLVPDLSRQEDEVLWKPRFDLRSGIYETVEWWRRRTYAA